MRIVVLVKPVPDTASGGERLRPDWRLDRVATPAVVGAPSGMTARFCPCCGRNIEKLWNRDVKQIRVQTWIGATALTIALITFIVGGRYVGLF